MKCKLSEISLAAGNNDNNTSAPCDSQYSQGMVQTKDIGEKI